MAKPEGFEFWRTKLKLARLVVAPMVDQSELAWRMMSRKYGAELCYTPMFHASVFVRDAGYRQESLQSCDGDRPLIIQFCANDPETFLKAAQLAESHCEAIDLNLGCPQSIARKGHYGAFLQDEWDLLTKMVSLCHSKLKVPITCKVRVYESIEKTVKYAKMLEKAGCQLLTVHGRTKEQKGPHTGLASWDHIRAVRENVNIPVYANGNIQYLSDVTQCMKETGVHGVMSAEGNLHNPALFKDLSPPVWQMAMEYLDFAEKYPCPIPYVRGHVFKLLHHALQVHQDVRDEVALAKTLEDFRRATSHIQEKCLEHVKKYEENPEDFQSSLPLPYWLCQPYVRPEPTAELSAEKKAERERLNIKRNLEMSALAIEGLSRKKLRKKLRNPHKNFDPEHKTKFETCVICCNPKGRKCEYSLCKSCCRKKAYSEVLDCSGHYMFFKTKALRREAEAGKVLKQASKNCDSAPKTDISNCNTEASKETQECDCKTQINCDFIDICSEDRNMKCNTNHLPGPEAGKEQNTEVEKQTDCEGSKHVTISEEREETHFKSGVL